MTEPTKPNELPEGLAADLFKMRTPLTVDMFTPADLSGTAPAPGWQVPEPATPKPDLYPLDLGPAVFIPPEVPPMPEHLQTLYTPEQWAEIFTGDAKAAWDRQQARAKRVARGT